MEAVSVKQTDVFDAAVQFAKVETILPAPESSHAIRAAIDEALKCKETGEAKTILFGLTGTGYFDMAAYEAYHNGTMRNHVPTDDELQVASIPFRRRNKTQYKVYGRPPTSLLYIAACSPTGGFDFAENRFLKKLSKNLKIIVDIRVHP